MGNGAAGKQSSKRAGTRFVTPAMDRHIRRRIQFFAAAVASICFGGLLVRLFVLQILDPENYADRAAGQQLRDTTLPAARGEIYSADGVTLAASETCWTIRASPRELQDELVEPAAKALSEILELDEQAVLKKLSQRSSNDCLLRRRVDAEMAAAVRTWCAEHDAKGIQILQDTRRVYPEGDFMGCILGFTDVDNQGLWGLELEYDEQLTGENGTILTAKNAWGYDMPTHYSTLQEAVPGSSLTLTIRDDIQHYLESALTAAVEEHHVSARAVGIVMDVNTGAILAMSTKPDYDPNNPRVLVDEAERSRVNALTGEERSAALQAAQQAQWRNKAISDLYEPGSVFKLITCSAALDTGAVTANTTFVCAGKINVAGTSFRCANGHIHGAETVAQGLAVSCNPCFIQIGARLGKENFCRYFEAFGLRSSTGIDLPGEMKRSEYYTADRMGPVELASCSFGQSSKISYLQMLTAVCAVVNGGRLMQPYVVAAITDADGQVSYEAQPTVKAQVIREETSAVMRELMEGVVTFGTGKNAAVAGYRVGGKSGTSQKLDSENERARIASFVAVAPIEEPRLAVLICLDEPHSWTTSGGALSGPVCAEVLRKSLPRLGIEPSYTEKEQEKYFTVVPDVTGWRTAAAGQKLAEYSLAADVLGEGERVQSQYPAAGTSVRKNSAIQLDTTGSLDPAADE
ncbi:MAG: penicillin-binding transpeptidase domain-containing protein [Gemmiger sp.]